MSIRTILEWTYNTGYHGEYVQGAIDEAERQLLELVDEELRKPIHTAAEKAGELDLANTAKSDYYNGAWNALYWVLSKMDSLFKGEQWLTGK